MQNFLLAFLSLLFFSACKKTNLPLSIPEGTYIGTFQRLTDTSGQISNVSITFLAGKYTGQSQYAQYPALCNGAYKSIGADSINFVNACFWTADFDWSLILNQNYKLMLSEKKLELTRNYPGQYTDTYKLTKQ